jgi:hypothetical protein
LTGDAAQVSVDRQWRRQSSDRAPDHISKEVWMGLKLDRRALGVIVVGALVAAIGATAAIAAKPIRNATYSGLISHTSNVTYPITFKVSASGRRVSDFTLSDSYPIYCQGGGFGAVQAASGKVSKHGKFRVRLPIYFAPTHEHQGFVLVTGTFGRQGRESGKVTTDFTHVASCNGTSRYTTHG